VCPESRGRAGRGPQGALHACGPMLTCASAAGAMALVLALLGLLFLTTSPVLVRGVLQTWVAVAGHQHATWPADGAKRIKYACWLALPCIHLALWPCTSV